MEPRLWLKTQRENSPSIHVQTGPAATGRQNNVLLMSMMTSLHVISTACARWGNIKCLTCLISIAFTFLLLLLFFYVGRSVNLTTLFLGRLRPPKRFTSTSCTYFRQCLTTAPLESAEGEMKVCGQTGYRTQGLRLTSQVPYRLRYAARQMIMKGCVQWNQRIKERTANQVMFQLAQPPHDVKITSF